MIDPYLDAQALSSLVQRLEVRLLRQKTARLAAETLLEEKSLALYRVNESLRELTNNLESEIAKQTQALKLALRQAQVATKAKDEFLANLSHEVRTPLNAINGLTEVLQRTELTPQQKEYLNLLETSAHGLLVLLDDVLDFSKMESGQFLFQELQFHVPTWLKETTAAYAVQAKSKGLEFKIFMAPDLPDILVGDPHRLRQVAANLLSNAVKFSAQGSISLEMALGAQTDLRPHEVRIAFVVQDTGIGIAPEQQQQIFEAFVQADSSITRRFGGTGLGLSIASRLVASMKGDLRVSSQSGQGSVFRFEVVLKQAAPPMQAHSPTTLLDHARCDMKGLKILVAEDHPVNQLLMRNMLSRLGAQWVIASDGVQALSAWEKEQFDLILMDIQMPAISGFEATQTIRSREKIKQQHIPIIALTACAMDGDKERCLAAGMDGYVTKPVSEQALCLAINAALSACSLAHNSGLFNPSS
jgi:signal transduction histidine kinase/ActR/RegA family two-component response regulator